MRREHIEDLIAKEVETIIAGSDIELVDVEYVRERDWYLRVFIDKEGGVLVDDCAIVSRQISGVLDVEDPISVEYTLEVSSPGMERPLFTLEQFAKYVGEQVKIKLRSPFEGRRNFQGLLRGVEEQDVVVQVDDHEFLLPIDMIDKANIIPSFD